jgi:hypothetical protein
MRDSVYISDVDINEAGEHEAFLQHKTIGLVACWQLVLSLHPMSQ